MRSLPRVVSQIPNDLRQFLEKVREYIVGAGDDQLVTKGDLIRGGIVSTTPNGTITPPVKPGIETPNVPTNLTTLGKFNVIVVFWDPINYLGHSYTEIWAADTNDFTAKVLLGTADGTVYNDAVGGGQTKYYWVRFVNQNGVAGPFNSEIGVAGTASSDPSYMLDLLAGSITETELSTNLNTRIDTAESDIQILQAEVNDLLNTPAYDNATTYNQGDVVTYNGGLYQAKQTTTGNLPTNTTYWLKIGDYASLGEAVAANTSDIQTLATDLGAETTARETLATQMRGSYTGTDVTQLTSGLVYSERQARSTAVGAEASARETLAAQIRGTYTGTDITQVTSGLIHSERTARANADGALASDISTLTTTVNGQTASIQTNTSSINGIRAQHTVKIDNNGYVSGYGLISTLADGGAATSDFVANVNRFAVTAPETSIPTRANSTAYTAGQYVKVTGVNDRMLVCKVAGTSGGSVPSVGAIGTLVTDGSVTWQVASRVPLAVLTTSLTANGSTLTPGVYIDGAIINNATVNSAQIADAAITSAKIVDASITNAKIANATIESAKIASLAADKITTGTLSASTVINVGTTSGSTLTNGIRIDGANQVMDVVQSGNTELKVGKIGTSAYGMVGYYDTTEVFRITNAGGLLARPNKASLFAFGGSYNYYTLDEGLVTIIGPNQTIDIPLPVTTNYSVQIFLKATGYYENAAATSSDSLARYACLQIYRNRATGFIASTGSVTIAGTTDNTTSFPVTHAGFWFVNATETLNLRFLSRTGADAAGKTWYRYVVWTTQSEYFTQPNYG